MSLTEGIQNDTDKSLFSFIPLALCIHLTVVQCLIVHL